MSWWPPWPWSEIKYLSQHSGELTRLLVEARLLLGQAHMIITGAKNWQDRICEERARLIGERDNLRACVEFYAEQGHLHLPEWEAPESGAEGCWLCPPSDLELREAWNENTPVAADRPLRKVHLDEPWMVEDGSVARNVLAGAEMWPNGKENDALICGAAPSARHGGELHTPTTREAST